MTTSPRKRSRSPTASESSDGPTEPPPRMASMILGWRVDSNSNPEYWMTATASPKPGAQPDTALVALPANYLGSNTIIVAQSGSGKSSFLARLVEELLLTSSSHCLIVDPNSDFRYFREIGNSASWENSAYDVKAHSGKLFTERSAGEFKRRWSKISRQITVLTGGISTDISSQTMLSPTIRWRDVPPDFMAEGLDSVHRVEMHHCHTFFSSLGEVFESAFVLRNPKSEVASGHPRGNLDMLHSVEPVFASLAEARSDGRLHGNDDVLRVMNEVLDERLPLPRGHSYSEAKGLSHQHGSKTDFPGKREDYHFRQIDRNLERAAVAFGHFTDVTGRHYFGLLQDLHAEGILSDRLEAAGPRRVEILDLPSVRIRSNRNLLVASFLDMAIARATENWESARSQAYIDPNSHPSRHPFFVILDEAHYLIPGDDAIADPSLELVRNRFRVIAAEGRKLGLFLILATQRPDKIDKFVLSECQNKVVMRLDNEASLEFVAGALGIQDAKGVMRKRCMGTGYRVLLTGGWTGYRSIPIYPAPRRTMEGGGSLEAADWTTSTG